MSFPRQSNILVVNPEFLYKRPLGNDPVGILTTPQLDQLVKISRRYSTAFARSRFDKREAQLSQRDRAMLRVTECFAESLKVIQNDSLQ